MTTEKGFGQASPELAAYTDRIFANEDEVLREVRLRLIAEGLPAIQVSRFDARHLEILARAIGARRIVEIGTLGGYSTISLARGLVPGGRVDTFEIDPKHARVARESFAKHGFGDRIRLHEGPALAGLERLAAEGPFDLMFVDGDKETYPAYAEWAEEHLRTGGLLIGDNCFAWGKLVDLTANSDPSTLGIHGFNERVAKGGRFRGTMLPTEDGLVVGVKVR